MVVSGLRPRLVRALLAAALAGLMLLGCTLSAPLLRPSGTPPEGQTPLISGANVTAAPQATAGIVRTVIITVPPFTSPQATPLSADALDALAQQSFAAVNAERSSLGLGALTWDEDIHTITRDVAAYLGQNHLFSHWLPDTPETTVSSLYGAGGACGENLALHYSIEALAAENWSESPPHYEIAIGKDYTRGAAAIATVQDYVRVYSPSGSVYGAQDETVRFSGTEYILAFRACE